jgi:DNA-binding transcriptional LysR family regulator/class 3 adenylate cyclase
MSSTRRLTAVFAADVAGYSRLMGLDEERTHERLKAHLGQLVDPKIREHRGHIVKHTGDGLLAEFASVIDAVSCAAEVQRGMIGRDQDVSEEWHIRFRIGINVGDIIVEEHDIFGDGVNVAARLQSLAEPGGICISKAVLEQIQGKLSYPFENKGEQNVKNMMPIQVYALPPQAIAILPLPDMPILPSRPSLRALRAFAELHRAGSVDAAARSLGISPSTESYLLRELEQTLGLSLFAGDGPPAPLSEAGERLLRGLGDVFERIELAVAEATRRENDLRVSALSTFSSLWLVPRLGRFQAAHPDTRLLLSTTTRPVDLAAEPIDCAIREGRDNLGWDGLDATLLFRERLVVVAHPHLLEREQDVSRMPRLAARARPADWARVLPALGVSVSIRPTLILESRLLAVQAALNGLGALAIDRILVDDLILSEKLGLVAPNAPEVPTHHRFFFVARPEKLREAHVRGLRDWLVAEVASKRGPGYVG